MANVLVIAELFEGKVRKGSLSAITFAQQAAPMVGGGYDILVAGTGAKAAAASMTGYGAESVLVADLPDYVAEVYAPVVAGAGKGYKIVCATATTFGKDLMPQVAEHLKAGMASDVVKVVQEGGPTYVRPMYAGNVLAHVKVKTPIQVVTVRQTEFEAAAPGGGASPVKDAPAAPATAAAARVKVAGFEKVVSARPELTDARVIVSGGRGLKSGENFKIIEALADLLHGAVGATRAAVDAGFAPNDLQVGQTGKIVAPQLYIAVGLSGALQHLAGMKGSKVIVAINKDPEAPIFSVADYGLVADLFQAVPALTEQIKKVL
ncbi:MAG: electron transfer flavoprotein subunit alpha/FixB family protein [Myxococcales bacterium]|nr:electron transfer flavoprotein subunit alpha/FixB family protein [Myxococcales bacterium]